MLEHVIAELKALKDAVVDYEQVLKAQKKQAKSMVDDLLSDDEGMTLEELDRKSREMGEIHILIRKTEMELEDAYNEYVEYGLKKFDIKCSAQEMTVGDIACIVSKCLELQ